MSRDPYGGGMGGGMGGQGGGRPQRIPLLLQQKARNLLLSKRHTQGKFVSRGSVFRQLRPNIVSSCLGRIVILRNSAGRL
jgi:hypothetical protein